jgi:hypothetical protein
VSHYLGRPFVLLGVNADDNVGVVRRLQHSGTVTWRSWWDGDPDQPYQICTSWQVEHFPRLFLIDHQGILRGMYEGVPDERELHASLDRLIKRAEAAARGSSITVRDSPTTEASRRVDPGGEVSENRAR